MGRVILIGEGIVGASVAYHLTPAGTPVTSVDASKAGQATAAGAGIVSPGGTSTQAPTYNRLMAASFEHYEWLIPQLADEGEPDTGFETVGALVVALKDQEHDRLDDLQRMAEERRDSGVHGIGDVQRIDSQTAREMFPALSNIRGALDIPGAARLDGRGSNPWQRRIGRS